MAFGNGTFVAVGSDGEIVYSSNGRDWILADSDRNCGLISVSYVNNQFLASSSGGIYGAESALVLSSVNGVTWSKECLDTSGEGIVSVAYGNNRYVGVGDTEFKISTNGAQWSFLCDSTLANDLGQNSIVFGNSIFVAVGGHGYAGFAADTAIWSSPDGFVWTGHPAGTKVSLQRVAYGNHIFVSVGTDNLQEGIILFSQDGISWSIGYRGAKYENIYSVTFDGTGQFVAIGDGQGSFEFLSSPNGASWTRQEVSQVGLSLRSIAFGNGVYVAVGDGLVMTAPAP